MLRTLGFAALAGLLVTSGACAVSDGATGRHDDDLRNLTTEEALLDLDAMAGLIRMNYGPLEYKKARFGLDLDAEIAAARSKILAATNEGDRIRPLYEVLAKLRDGHVGLGIRVRGTETAGHSLTGIFVTPLAGGYYVAFDTPSGLKMGDKLVSIDGIATARLEELLWPITEIGTPESTRHRIGLSMTNRPFYAPAELRPQGDTATIIVERGGQPVTVSSPWLKREGGTASLVLPSVPPPAPTAAPEDMTLSPHVGFILAEQMLAEHPELVDRVRKADRDGTPMTTVLAQGRLTPFYLTPQVQEHLGVVKVEPKAETLAAVGVTIPPAEAAATSDFGRFINLRAYKYRFAGKTILLVRIPGFTVPQNNYDVNVGWLTALLQENVAAAPDAPLAEAKPDVVVVDVAHNPGGSVPYCQGLASLFTDKPIGNTVQASRANRARISMTSMFANSAGDPLAKEIWKTRMLETEAAIDRGDFLAPFTAMWGNHLGPTVPPTGLTLAGGNELSPHPLVSWGGPLLVLHDELSSSGADAFPAMMKGREGAKTFGARTAGMGGNRLDFSLPATGGTLSLTGGLFGAWRPDPSAIALVENNGVLPDFPYEVTVADFKSGYIGYVSAFSQAAAQLTR